MKFEKMKHIVKTVAACLALLLLLASCSTPTDPEPTSTSAPEVSQLNGIELSKFTIVSSNEDHDYSKRAAEYVQSAILDRTGLELSLVEDDVSPAEYEIVVGETSREISTRLDADTEYTQFAILAEDQQIALEGDYFMIAAAAYFFVETYVPEDHVSAEIPKQVSIHEPIVEKAENFIVLIGDGMGVYQTKLFDVLENEESYGDGEGVFYGYYLPAHGFSRTNSLSGVTDSAAGGTALSCGVKTTNSRVGFSPKNRRFLSITELAAIYGLSTAVMSTEDATGATPASFSSHVRDRGMTNAIRSQQNQLWKTYGTLIDCGFDHYTEREVALIEDKVVTMYDRLDDNENGFFMMYEEAHIDKHCHSNDMANTYKAVVRFNQVIARTMEYAFYHPNTFVLITADHETGDLRPEDDGTYAYHSGGHTGDNVPVFVYGDGADLFDGVEMENIQIPQTIASFMGVSDFGDQTTYKPLTK